MVDCYKTNRTFPSPDLRPERDCIRGTRKNFFIKHNQTSIFNIIPGLFVMESVYQFHVYLSLSVQLSYVGSILYRSYRDVKTLEGGDLSSRARLVLFSQSIQGRVPVRCIGKGKGQYKKRCYERWQIVRQKVLPVHKIGPNK